MPSSSPARPKVLIVENGVAVSGGFRSVFAAALQQRLAFDFRFAVPRGSALVPIIRQEGFEVDEVPFVELGRSLRKLSLYVPALLINGMRLARLVRRHRIAVLHSNDLYNLAPYVAQRLLGRAAPRLVTHVRLLPASFSGPLYRFWCRMAIRFADRIVCVSQAVRQSAFPHEAKAVVVYDTLDRHENHPPKPDAAPADPDAPVRVLYLSNYMPGKGHLTALRGFAAAYAQNPALRLDFYGGTMGLDKNAAFRDQLRAEAATLGVAEVVNFHGFVNDVEGLIKSYDIVLNCSDIESFSMVCFEALYFGVPLIATDCGGPRELFEDGRSGYLIPVRDEAAAADRLLRLAADPALRRAFSQAGRAFVRQKFSEKDQSGAIWQFSSSSAPS